MGVMEADLHGFGIVPHSRDFCHIRVSGGDNASLHFFSSIAGKPSGPGAALGERSSMASCRSDSEKWTLLREGESEEADAEFGELGAVSGKRAFAWMFPFLGLLNTELYCSLRISAIS